MRVLADGDRMQAFELGIIARVAGTVEIAAQRGIAFLARRLHPVHHAAQGHAHHDQGMRSEHQAAFHQFRHHFGRARLLQLVEVGIVVAAHDDGQGRRHFVKQVQ
ncbi:hypothetical protein D3C72_1809890 [compost metagenome]